MDWLYVFGGLLVGAVVGMTGVGGGSLMTPLLVMGFGVAPVVGSRLTTALGVALVVSAVALVFKDQLQHLAAARASTTGAWRVRHAGLLTVLVGAGALGAIALLLLYPHLPTKHVAGTDIVHPVPLTLVAGASHAVAARCTTACSAAC